uniref:Copper transport protein n=1 Tax=Mycena chlorophos TaxID=658473 RepID=A0ABQ0LL62_MYCCL|nr:predicted protein [Mycena chlorophos]
MSTNAVVRLVHPQPRQPNHTSSLHSRRSSIRRPDPSQPSPARLSLSHVSSPSIRPLISDVAENLRGAHWSAMTHLSPPWQIPVHGSVVLGHCAVANALPMRKQAPEFELFKNFPVLQGRLLVAPTGTGMSSNTTTSMDSMMMMKAYLHFTPGDMLLFKSIAPSSPGAIFGACLILFLIAIGERGLLALGRRFAKVRTTRAERLLASRSYIFDDASAGKAHDEVPSSESSSGGALQARTPAPFILSHELSRGALAGVQTTVHYVLMLVVMTFNAAFLISVVLGVVVGEVVFGRMYH